MSPRRSTKKAPPMEITEAQRSGESAVLSERTDIVISPTPRPIKQRLPEDVFAKYEQGMRAQASDLYRRLKLGPVPIAPALPEVVTWMRGKGVRIITKMTVEGSFYELEPTP
jgi:hypothetical protein